MRGCVEKSLEEGNDLRVCEWGIDIESRDGLWCWVGWVCGSHWDNSNMVWTRFVCSGTCDLTLFGLCKGYVSNQNKLWSV
ncbi:hypothetical protein HanRHA438_Chr10g0432031 [Helianthus annuus]|nr:hypothetical protein HanRHA438_Chr10g0432031 [Helianthus annuus]